MKCILLLMAILLGISELAMAQKAPPSDNKDTVSQKQLFINPGFNYISDLTYAGRKNIVSAPVLTPYVNLILKKGFFLSATGYINASKGQFGIDGASITPGYVFQLSKHFNGYASATKYFLADSSSLILASIKGSIDAGFGFSSKLIDAGVTLDYIFGEKQDFLTGVNLSKDIKASLFKNISLKISPTASFTAGTQSFYKTYYINTITQKRNSSGSPPSRPSGILGGILGPDQGDGDTSSTVINTVTTEKKQKEIRKFNPLNISFYVPVNVHVGKFKLSLTPNIVFPFNQVNLSDGPSSVQLNKPFFFYTAGMSLVF